MRRRFTWALTKPHITEPLASGVLIAEDYDSAMERVPHYARRWLPENWREKVVTNKNGGRAQVPLTGRMEGNTLRMQWATKRRAKK